MITWACVAYLTLQAQKNAERRILFQTQEENKAIELIDYAKCLYKSQPQWLKDAFPLTKDIDTQEARILSFANGSEIWALVGGASKIRSYHPWGYLNDESSFQPEAGECYTEALAAAKGKIIFNSSAGPGWYADFRRDVVHNIDE